MRRMSLAVVVPSYQRPIHLRRCLNALLQQTRQADEVIVVARETDRETLHVVEEARELSPAVRFVTVKEAGLVAALNTGLGSVRSELVAFTDDDAEPWPSWLERIEHRFQSDRRIAGVGGIDHVIGDCMLPPRTRGRIGQVAWYGKVSGFHQVGAESPRYVDLLRGVNCAYRTETISSRGFDNRLRGMGAQAHWELAIGLNLRREGYLILYDPLIGVDHYHAPRPSYDPRYSNRVRYTMADSVHNETLVILEHFHFARRVVFYVWSTLIGTSEEPGLAQLIRRRLTGRTNATWDNVAAVCAGRYEGWKTWRKTRARPEWRS